MEQTTKIDAIQWHSLNPAAFNAQYACARDFAERLTVWTGLITDFGSTAFEVLDLGCGTGTLSFVAAEHNKSVLGIDGSLEMIQFCETRKRGSQAENTRFLQARIEELPGIRLDPVDLVICSSVLEYVEDLKRCVRILVSLIKPGGTGIVSLPNRSSVYRRCERFCYALTGHPGYLAYLRSLSTAAEFKDLLRENQVEPVRCEYFGRPDPITPLLPRRFAERALTTMFVCIFRKTGAVTPATR